MASLDLERCFIGSNRAGNGGRGGFYNNDGLGLGGEGGQGGDGGGIYDAAGAGVTLVRSIVDGNLAGDGAPGGVAAPGTPGQGGRGGHGGGLGVLGELTMIDSTVQRNRAGAGGTGTATAGPGPATPGARGGHGGGILGGFRVTLDRCTINGNVAGTGGAGATVGVSAGGGGGDGGGLRWGNNLSMVNCTVSGNEAGAGGAGGTDGTSAGGDGGWGGGLAGRIPVGMEFATAGITHSTVTLNRTGMGGAGALMGADGRGGGLAQMDTFFNSIMIGHSVFDGNLDAAGGADDIDGDAGGPAQVQSLGYIVANEVNWNVSGNLANVKTLQSANLMGLAQDLDGARQGPTWSAGMFPLVHAIDEGSPAFDCGNPNITGEPATDQRAKARVSGAAIDLGAFEAQVGSTADLGISKSMPAFVQPGEQFEITLTVSNLGPATALCYEVFDSLPSDLTFVSSADCVDAGGVFCTASNLVPGGVETFRFTVEVAAFAFEGTNSNYASVLLDTSCDPLVTDTNSANDSTEVSYVVRRPDLTVEKTGPATAAAGDRIDYKIGARNLSDFDALEVVVADALHPDLELVAAPAFCALGPASLLVCDLGTLAASSATSFLITVEIASDTPWERIWNPVEIGQVEQVFLTINPVGGDQSGAAAVGGGGEVGALQLIDGNASNNVFAVPFTVQRIADATMTKSSAATDYTVGDPITWSIVISNAGPNDLCAADFKDSVPPEIGGVNWTCAATPGNGGELKTVDTASPATDGGYSAVAAHPNNEHVFAAGTIGGLHTLRLDPVSGQLTPLLTTSVPQFAVLDHLVVTADGLHVYGASADRIFSFVFDETVPSLTVGTNNPVASSSGLHNDLVASPDGLHLYALEDNKNVVAYARDLLTGELTVIETETLPAGGAGASALLASPDGNHLYALELDRVHVYDRDPVTGELAASTVSPVAVGGVAFDVSADGKHVYLLDAGASKSLLILDRDPTTGDLAANGSVSVSGGATGVVVTPDGKTVHVAGQSSTGQIQPFHRDGDSGQLTAGTALDVTDLGDLVVTPNSRHVFHTALFTVNSVQRAGYNRCESAAGSGNSINNTLDIAAGGRVTITVRGVVDSCADTCVTNTACLTYPPNLMTSAGATQVVADDAVCLRGAVDLSVAKTMSNVVFGDTAVIELLVSNAGPCTAVNVVVADLLDTNLFTTGPFSRSLGDLGPGASTTITVMAGVRLVSLDGDCLHTNVATVTNDVFDTDPVNNRYEVEFEPESRYDLAVSKSGPATVAAGDRFDVTITVSNAGPSIANGAQVFDVLPPGVRHVTNDCGAFAVSTSVMQWELPPLPPGVTSCVLTLEIPDCCLDAVVTNKAFHVPVSANLDCAFGQDSNPANDTGTLVTVVTPDVLAPVLSNCPANTVVADRSLVPGPVLPTASDDCAASVTPFLVSSNEVASGCVGRVTYVYGVDDDCGNYAACTQVVTYAVNAVDVSVVKTTSDQPVFGGTMEFELVVSNAGPCTAVNVLVSDALDPDFFTPSGLAVFPVGDLAPGASTSLFVSTVLRDPPGREQCVITNTATVTNDVPDANPLNNAASLILFPLSKADLAITKTMPSAVAAGDPFQVVLMVSNAGPSLARDIVVGDFFPFQFNLASNTCGGVDSGDGWSWRIDSLPAGASTSCSIVVTTDCCYDGVFTNVAFVDVVSGLPFCLRAADTNFANNSASAVVVVTGDGEAPVFTSVPGDLLLECGDALPPTVPVVASDNCSTVTVVQTSSTNFQCLGHVSVITNTWTATDACGNSNMTTQVITVQDTLPPVILSCPSNMVVADRSLVPPPDSGSIVVTDRCDAVEMFVTESNETTGVCSGVVQYVYSVGDGCGNVSTCVQTIVYDIPSTPRILSCPTDMVFQCVDDVPPPDPSAVVATDVCGEVFISVEIQVEGTNACSGDMAYIYTVSNAAGRLVRCVQSISYSDALPPVITSCPTSMTVDCVDLVPAPDPGAVVATDNCSTVSVALVSSPPVNLDPCTGQVVYVYRAADRCDNETLCTQIVTYADLTPPVITFCPSNQTLPAGSSLDPSPGDVVATDTCGSVTVDVFSRSETTNACGREAVFVYRATDNCGNIALCTQTVAAVVPSSPVLIGCPSNQTVACRADVPGPAAVTATDRCSVATVSVITNLSGDACAGRVQYIHVATAAYGVAACTQDIDYADTTAPTLAGVPATLSLTGDADCWADVVGLTPSATDNCDTNVTASYAPTRVTGPGPHPVIVQATDACGNTAVATVMVSVACTPGIALSKTVALGGSAACPGDESVAGTNGAPVTYCFVIANNGTVHLSGIVLTDPQLSLTRNYSGLAPGQAVTGSFASVIDGDLVNTATVVGTPSDSDGIAIPGLANVTDSDSASVSALVRIGDFVWLDLDADGEQDASEPGVSNIVVELLPCADAGDEADTVEPFPEKVVAAIGQVATSDVNGAFVFVAPPGDYQLRFQVPPGFSVTTPDAVDDRVDSDVDPTTFVTTRCTGPLAGGDEDPDLDLGLLQSAEIGGTVWVDLNYDGLTDGDNLVELGIPDVIVRLYRMVGSTPAFLTNVVSGPVPGNNGFFGVTVNQPGTYVVEVDIDSLPDSLKIRSTPLSHVVVAGGGAVSLANNFGFAPYPTSVRLERLTATAEGGGTRVTWTTSDERDVLGYQVHRSGAAGGERVQVGQGVVLAEGGGGYELSDTEAGAWYWLAEIGTDLSTSWHGPVRRGVESAVVEAAGLVLVPVADPATADLVRNGAALRSIQLADALVAYLDGAAAVTVARSDNPHRMPTRDATPSSEDGDIELIGAEDNAAEFTTTGRRVVVMRVAGTPVLVDVTDPANPVQWTGARLGEDGLYFEGPARRRVLIRGFE